ncbi:FAD binding domain-containing protein [Candidatus Halocynthiibacter alkanivorans]|uniref:FAD binding domain-containing protein n=1 Tax=Candidatus Halocynthiibacter alkanivorans TaxID=2267619 RepID=UPI000DF17041|nr:FAD binding domain-containing protein [Candidatus Halocynthiibacter alkanivorans]
MLTCDNYHLPITLQDALVLWAAAPEGSRLVAGATDLLPWAREGRAGEVHIPALVDLSRVAELHGYTTAKGRVRLGANTVWQAFLTDSALRRLLPCMPHCSSWFADDQIREQATLAGNLANASPVADGTPPVAALNGVLELAHLEGDTIVARTVAVSDFVLGPGRTVLEPGEIITAVTLDSASGYGGSFQKVGQRRSLVISVACCAALVKTDNTGCVFEDVRLSLGGVGPRPIRLNRLESALRGERISHGLIDRAAHMAAAEVASRSRQQYRRSVVVSFVGAAIRDALADQSDVVVNFQDTEETASV